MMNFNSRYSWWSDGINTKQGLKLFSLTSSDGFSKLINEPTHIQGNSSSCIDLTFKQIYQLTQVSMHLSIRTAIIILFTLALTLILTIPHSTNV